MAKTKLKPQSNQIVLLPPETMIEDLPAVLYKIATGKELPGSSKKSKSEPPYESQSDKDLAETIHVLMDELERRAKRGRSFAQWKLNSI